MIALYWACSCAFRRVSIVSSLDANRSALEDESREARLASDLPEGEFAGEEVGGGGEYVLLT